MALLILSVHFAHSGVSARATETRVCSLCLLLQQVSQARSQGEGGGEEEATMCVRLLASSLLLSHWRKQVPWPSPGWAVSVVGPHQAGQVYKSTSLMVLCAGKGAEERHRSDTSRSCAVLKQDSSSLIMSSFFIISQK